MENYIFLTENFNENGITKYYAINPDAIQTLNLCETYDRFGQQVGHYNAGDYHFGNDASDAKSDCIKDLAAYLSVDSDNIHIVELDEETYIIEPGDGEEYGYDEERANEFIKKWRQENEYVVEVKGFDYFDGNNFRTITTEVPFGESSHEILTDKNLIDELNEAIENKELKNKGFGLEIYESGDWTILESHFQGAWSSYEILKNYEYNE